MTSNAPVPAGRSYWFNSPWTARVLGAILILHGILAIGPALIAAYFGLWYLGGMPDPAATMMLVMASVFIFGPVFCWIAAATLMRSKRARAWVVWSVGLTAGQFLMMGATYLDDLEPTAWWFAVFPPLAVAELMLLGSPVTSRWLELRKSAASPQAEG